MTRNTLSERIERTCKAFGHSTAFLENGMTPVSFSNVFMAILRFAECLTDAGVKPGDHIVVAMRDMISVTAMKLAIIRLGATPMSGGAAAVESRNEVRVNWIVRPRPDCTGQALEIPFDQAWIQPPTRYTPITPGGRIIHATSGTTGLPKLRNDSEETFLARIKSGLAARGALDGPVFVAQNVGSLIGLKSIVSSLLETQCVMPMMSSPEQTVQGLARHQIVHAFIPPLHLKRLVDAAEAINAKTPTLRRINVGGGAINGDFAARCERVFDCDVYTDYGSTETDTNASYRPSLNIETPGLVGPFWNPFDYRFQTLNGEASTPEEGGELFLQVPLNMRTQDYPEGIALFDEDGWISTGDIGRMTPDGNLVLVGRKSELINVGGNKIAPDALEQCAIGHSAVIEVLACRVPTQIGIDAIGFGVVVTDQFDESDFRLFLEKNINDMYDFRILILDVIPRTDAGKSDRKALAAAFQRSSN
jgi:acyl-coenzyme A synthetase/AMP-(fatty) acid ligase